MANRDPRPGEGGVFDYLYHRDAIDAVLGRLLPRELAGRQLRALGGNGFLTASHLGRIRATIEHYLVDVPSRGPRRAVLVDIGCGAGGLGRWLADNLDMRLIGIDSSPLAIARARRSVAERPRCACPTFEVADFTRTGLPNAVATAVVSWDALYLATDPAAALREIRRILRTGGGLLFTAYVGRLRRAGAPHQFGDWLPVLAASGFSVERCVDGTAEWRRIMRKKHERRWARRAWLRRRLGTRVEPELSVTAAMLGLSGRPSFLDEVKRVEFSARRM